jgi:hypothetical protein
MESQLPKKPSTNQRLAEANHEAKRRLKRIVYFGGGLAMAMLTLNFVPVDSEPWVWIKLAVLTLGTIIFVTWVTRFSLWQRHEYWRERGRDPKHPERFPERSDEN